jgi:putative thioredoxin
MLESLAEEAQGSFRLARVDVDANPTLAMRYGVRSVPTVKAISQGQVVGEFAGLQPEPRVREFLSRLAPPSETNLTLEKANSLLAEQAWSEAEALYRELDEQPPVMLGLVKTLLAQGKSGEALFALNNFPASKEYASAELLRPLAESLVKFEKDELPDENELDAMFRSSLRLAKRGNHAAALDGLLDLLRQQKRYRGDRARQVFLGILALYSHEDPFAKEYRGELATVLF